MAGPMNFMAKHIWPSRKNMVKKDKIDRISNLPDEILQSILSLLPTKDATRTIVLSKQWQNIWESFVRQGQDLILPTIIERQVFRISVVESVFDDDLILLLGGYDLDIVDDEIRNGVHRLCLTNVVVADDKALENFISKCIFLKELDLNFSDGLKLGGSHWRHEMPTMPTCTTLKRLTLEIPNMRGHWFQNQIVSKLPFLEELELKRCYMLESLHILSTSLKSLCLIKCHSLKEINIDTANLTFFGYSSRNIIPFTSMKMQANWISLRATIHLYTKQHHDAFWLIKLVGIVAKFSQSRGFETRIIRDSTQTPSNRRWLSLSVESRRGEDVIIPEELKGNFLPPLVAVHHFRLDVRVKQKSCKEYVAPSRWFPFHSAPLYKETKFNDLYIECLLEEVWRRERERSLKSPLRRVRQFLTHL